MQKHLGFDKLIISIEKSNLRSSYEVRVMLIKNEKVFQISRNIDSGLLKRNNSVDFHTLYFNVTDLLLTICNKFHSEVPFSIYKFKERIARLFCRGAKDLEYKLEIPIQDIEKVVGFMTFIGGNDV